MIIVIRCSPFKLFCYWKKPVEDLLGRPGQNGRFIVVIRPHGKFALSLQSDENWPQDGNRRIITDLITPGIIQIPIVSRDTASPCPRPAVSSLGACPTPAP